MTCAVCGRWSDCEEFGRSSFTFPERLCVECWRWVRPFALSTLETSDEPRRTWNYIAAATWLALVVAVAWRFTR